MKERIPRTGIILEASHSKYDHAEQIHTPLFEDRYTQLSGVVLARSQDLDLCSRVCRRRAVCYGTLADSEDKPSMGV